MRELIAAVLACACGGAQRDQVARETQVFSCRERAASYVVSRHMAGAELGVEIDCAPVGPRIKRWRVDSAGTRQEDARGMSPGEFDKIWREIDGTGWPNLRDCANGSGDKGDPIYKFDIKDDQNQASFQCQSQSMPYPYHVLVDPLDLAAQDGRGQLGDDEPAEIKELERKANPSKANPSKANPSKANRK